MRFDVPFAGWVLAALTFVAGTVVPPIYSRLSYEGFAVRQPFDVRGYNTDPQPPGQDILFTTLLKFANTTSSSMLVEDVRLAQDHLGGKGMRLIGVTFKDVSERVAFSIPLVTEPGVTLNYLPFIVKADAERTIAIEFRLRPEPPVPRQVTFGGDTLNIEIRINGRYRTYTLEIRNR